MLNARTGPFVRLPVGTPGRHTVAIAAANPRGSAIGTRRQVFRVTIDRERPRAALAVRRGGLLEVRFRAQAGDGVAGVPEGSLRVRTSESPNSLRGPTAKVTFTRAGPYWVEAEAADWRVTSGASGVLSWPAGPVGRRLAWNDALVTLRMPFVMARRHRRFDSHYRPRARLVRLLAANCEPRVCRDADADLAASRGAVGVWSDGRRKMLLSTGASGPPLRHGGPRRPPEQGACCPRRSPEGIGLAWAGGHAGQPSLSGAGHAGDVQRAHPARIAIDAGLARVPHSSPGVPPSGVRIEGRSADRQETWKRVSPGSDWRRSSPWWRRTMRWAMSSPRPVPRPTGFVVKKASKTRARPGGTPGPSSPTSTSTRAPGGRSAG